MSDLFTDSQASMFGITDFAAFCAAILIFLALPGPGRLRACEVFRRARAGVRKGVDQGAMHSRSSGYGEHLQRRAAPFRAHERVWRNASQVLSRAGSS